MKQTLLIITALMLVVGFSNADAQTYQYIKEVWNNGLPKVINTFKESKGKLVTEFGKYGTKNIGLSFEGPLNETTSYRVAISSQDTDGQYKAFNDDNLTLGARETVSIAGTLYFEPSDRFNAKLRFHTWEDNDGPGAAFGYGVNNGEELFDCLLPNSTLAVRSGGGNWFCGVAPFPTAQYIQYDDVMSSDKVDLLNGVATTGLTIDTITDNPFLHGFGFAREAEQFSLIMNYELDNGVTITSITASNENRWMALDDLDRRATADLGIKSVSLLNGRDLDDFSQEIRFTSPQDQRLRWMIGLSKFEFEGKIISGEPVDLDGNSISPGDDWYGPHVGIPYVLCAGGNDIRYKIRPRPNVIKEIKLSNVIGKESAKSVAEKIRSLKGYEGGKFYVNELCSIFAPIQADEELKYVYIGKLDLQQWFPAPCQG